MYKHTMLLARGATVSHEEFVGYWLQDHVPTARRLPDLLTYATVLPVDTAASTYDGIAELTFENHGSLRAWLRWSGAGRHDPDHPYRKEAREDLRRFAPAENRREFVGETTVQLDETQGSTNGLFKHTACFVRNGNLEHEDFREHWLHGHVPKAAAIPGVVKCVTGEPLNPAKVEFDGVTELYFEDYRALEAALGYAGAPEHEPEHPMAKEARAETLDFLSVEHSTRFVGEVTVHADETGDRVRSVDTGSGSGRGTPGGSVEVDRGPAGEPAAGRGEPGPDRRTDRPAGRGKEPGPDRSDDGGSLTSTMQSTSVSAGGSPDGSPDRRDPTAYDSLDHGDGPDGRPGDPTSGDGERGATVRRAFPELAHIEDGDLRAAVVDAWVAALEAGDRADPTTVPFAPSFDGVSNAQHVRGVTATAIRLAEVLAESHGIEPDMDVLRAGALLHDLGKCTVDEATVEGTALEAPSGRVPSSLSGRDFASDAGCPATVLAALPDGSGGEGDPNRSLERFVIRTANAASSEALTEAAMGTSYDTWVGGRRETADDTGQGATGDREGDSVADGVSADDGETDDSPATDAETDGSPMDDSPAEDTETDGSPMDDSLTEDTETDDPPTDDSEHTSSRSTRTDESPSGDDGQDSEE